MDRDGDGNGDDDNGDDDEGADGNGGFVSKYVRETVTRERARK